MENTKISKPWGFMKGINEVAETRPKADYDLCLKELANVILTTEERGSSVASYYNKRNGRVPLTLAENERINEVFAKYGVSDWQGVE